MDAWESHYPSIVVPFCWANSSNCSFPSSILCRLVVCDLAFHSAGKVARWAHKQTVQQRAGPPPLFPGELAFLFRLQAVKDLESWCRCPELIALSWSKLHGLPNVQKMFINTVSSRIPAQSCPWVEASPWCHPLTPASPHSKGSCHFQSPGQNYKLPLVKIDTSVTGCSWGADLFSFLIV